MKIKVKKFVDDPSKSWEERFKALEVHHLEETRWLIQRAESFERWARRWKLSAKQHGRASARTVLPV